jgi:hypothetical protein
MDDDDDLGGLGGIRLARQAGQQSRQGFGMMLEGNDDGDEHGTNSQ